MISAKYAVIAAVAAFAVGSFFTSPLPDAIAAVIATDVQCTGCVGTSDLAGNAVTAAKIKDSEVKAAEIATGAVGASEIAADAVGGSELVGVTKLLFGQCTLTSAEANLNVTSGGSLNVLCTITGTDADDSAIATMRTGSDCFHVAEATPTDSGDVRVRLRNECNAAPVGPGTIAVIVYDK